MNTNFNKKHIAAIAYVLILSLILVLIYHTMPNVTTAKFKLESYTQQQSSSNYPIFESYIIPQPSFLRTSHSATFEVLENGDLLAFWFAGSHEGKPDVKIWSSKFIKNQWTNATIATSPQIISNQLSQYVNKVGNPVIYKAANGILNLFVVSVGAIGGWSASNLEQIQSTDNGVTWKKPKKLILSPLLNMSTLVRTKAIPLDNGGFYLPIYQEMIYTYPELLSFDENGNFIQKIRATSKRGVLQPAIVPVTLNTGYAFLRNKGYHNTILYMQYTKNGGLSWSNPRATNMSNRDSSIAVAVLNQNSKPQQSYVAICPKCPNMHGRLLMVHNPLDRGKLVLSISDDAIHFKNIVVLEDKAGGEYSYPSIQVHNGLIDILYTEERKNIKHIRFNQAWLDKEASE